MPALEFCPLFASCLSQEHDKIITKLLVILKDRNCLKADFTQPHRLTANPKHVGPDFLQGVIRDRADMIRDYLEQAWERFARTDKVSCWHGCFSILNTTCARANISWHAFMLECVPILT